MTWLHDDIDADNARSAADQAIESHSGGRLDGAEVAVYDRADATKFDVHQAADYELISRAPLEQGRRCFNCGTALGDEASCSSCGKLQPDAAARGLGLEATT